MDNKMEEITPEELLNQYQNETQPGTQDEEVKE